MLTRNNEIFTHEDIDFIKSLGGEWDDGNQYYFIDYDDNKLHICIYGAYNGYYAAKVGDSCGTFEKNATGKTIKDAIKNACDRYCSHVSEILEAISSIEKLKNNI